MSKVLGSIPSPTGVNEKPRNGINRGLEGFKVKIQARILVVFGGTGEAVQRAMAPSSLAHSPVVPLASRKDRAEPHLPVCGVWTGPRPPAGRGGRLRVHTRFPSSPTETPL